LPVQGRSDERRALVDLLVANELVRPGQDRDPGTPEAGPRPERGPSGGHHGHNRRGRQSTTGRRTPPILYILHGRVRPEYGPGLAKVVDNQAGAFISIEPGVPHEVFHLRATEPVIAVVARSDADEWQNFIPYDRAAVTKEREDNPTPSGFPGGLKVDE
jgi:hypothetical protein